MTKESRDQVYILCIVRQTPDLFIELLVCNCDTKLQMQVVCVLFILHVPDHRDGLYLDERTSGKGGHLVCSPCRFIL